MQESHFTESDRALIIKLSVQVERAISDIADLRSKYERREEDFATKKDISNFVTQLEFDPIKKLVYGGVSIVLSAILGGAIYLLIKH